MDIYQKAIEESEKSKTIRVFAPVGLWSVLDEKEKWIQCICNAKDKDRVFIYGSNSNPKHLKLIRRRVADMKKAGVSVLEIPIQKDYKYGFIILDHMMIIATNGGFSILGNCEAARQYRQIFDTTRVLLEQSKVQYNSLLDRIEKEVATLKITITNLNKSI